MSVDSAQLQRWFARLVDLDPTTADAELDVLAQTDGALAARLRDLLAADLATADAPTEPLVPGLQALRSGERDWEGRSVGPWRVIERIGSGGMGSVYRAARMPAMKEVVALKLLRADRDDAGLRRRFALERRVLQSLQHAGIARLIDAGEAADGTPFVAMELIEGTHLLAYADQQRLSLDQRLDLLLKVCAAVAHAHAHQVVHRDIKSSNILVTPQGQPKLLDFGIAKPLQAQFGHEYLERTATAQRFFSAASAAPEQLSGAPTGPACDVYALGALLYELLCGEAPLALHGLSAGQAELAITQQIPLPPSQRLAALPPGVANARARQRGLEERAALADGLRGELDRIATKALRKAPAQRQASVEQFARELRAVRTGRIELTALQRIVAGCRTHPRLLLGAGALAAVLSIALALPPRRAAIVPAAPDAVENLPDAQTPSTDDMPGLANQPDVLLALAQSQLQRREDAKALATLAQAEQQFTATAESRERRLQLLSLRAAAATRSGDFPLAAQALDQADGMSVTAAERAGLALQRARLLTARGRETQAAALLREIAADTLPRLRADDPLAAEIRRQADGLEKNTATVAAAATTDANTATAAPVAVPQALRARLESLSRDLEAARLEAGIDAPPVAHGETLAMASTSPSAGETATVPSNSTLEIPDDSRSAAARALADDVARACALNARGDYTAAQALLDPALERQRSEPGLRQSDDYRIGVLAAAIARHGSSPSIDFAERLRHELTRDVWLSSADGRARWREQAAIAQALGVTRAD